MDAVIVRLSACWSPVKDKETPVAQLTLSDGLCEKQPPCACARASLPPPSAFWNKAEQCGTQPNDKFSQTAERLHKEMFTAGLMWETLQVICCI